MIMELRFDLIGDEVLAPAVVAANPAGSRGASKYCPGWSEALDWWDNVEEVLEVFLRS